MSKERMTVRMVAAVVLLSGGLSAHMSSLEATAVALVAITIGGHQVALKSNENSRIKGESCSAQLLDPPSPHGLEVDRRRPQDGMRGAMGVHDDRLSDLAR